jgi:hypothetical protein
MKTHQNLGEYNNESSQGLEIADLKFEGLSSDMHCLLQWDAKKAG